jgi:hypothetical protein
MDALVVPYTVHELEMSVPLPVMAKLEQPNEKLIVCKIPVS